MVARAARAAALAGAGGHRRGVRAGDGVPGGARGRAGLRRAVAVQGVRAHADQQRLPRHPSRRVGHVRALVGRVPRPHPHRLLHGRPGRCRRRAKRAFAARAVAAARGR
eukprot:scaffold2768_cov314-Prasinococcus_capsulatus_cf.AAC.7